MCRLNGKLKNVIIIVNSERGGKLMKKVFDYAIGIIIAVTVLSVPIVSVITQELSHDTGFFDFPWWLNSFILLFILIPWIDCAFELCLTLRDILSKRALEKSEIVCNAVSASLALGILATKIFNANLVLVVVLCLAWTILRLTCAIKFRKTCEKTNLLKSPLFYVITVVLVVIISAVTAVNTDMGKEDTKEYENVEFSSEKILEAWTGDFSEDELTKAISKYEKSYFPYELAESEKSVPFFLYLNYEPAGAAVVRLSSVDTDNIDVELDGYIDMQPEVTCISNNVAVDLSWWFNEKDSWCGNYTMWSYLLRVTDSDGLKHYYYFRVSYSNDNE